MQCRLRLLSANSEAIIAKQQFSRHGELFLTHDCMLAAFTSRALLPQCPHVPEVSSADRDQRLEETVDAIRGPTAPFPAAATQ
jgi:hypothetical protein